jgi:MraZ protein
MFASTYQYSIDDKGRLSIPSAYCDQLKREKAAMQLYLRVAPDKHKAIWAYTAERFDEISREVLNDPAEQDAFRRLMANTHLCQIDKQCRIIVPSFLRDKAGITRDVAVVGVGRRIEIWDRAAFATYSASESTGSLSSKFLI